MKRKSHIPQKTTQFVKFAQYLFQLETQSRYQSLSLEEYPFDLHLLTASALYRKSRKLYQEIGGKFKPVICSTLRSLSAQDLFKDEIQYSPVATEMMWFKDFYLEVSDPDHEVDSIMRFNEISLFHEQNHRIIWRLLPPPPDEFEDLSRYLNFAESLVVTLDLALGDELGKKNSAAFEKLKLIYRPGGRVEKSSLSKDDYRQYLLGLFCSTYYILEFVNYEDIQGAVDYILPNSKKLNKVAVKRSLEISELFTRVTNPLWQERYSSHALDSLKRIHQKTQEPALYLSEDPLDISADLHLVKRVFDFFDLSRM